MGGRETEGVGGGGGGVEGGEVYPYMGERRGRRKRLGEEEIWRDMKKIEE